MPRYFFHVHLGETVGLDVVGLELADLCQAIASAHRAIIEIMSEDGLGQLWLEIAEKAVASSRKLRSNKIKRSAFGCFADSG